MNNGIQNEVLVNLRCYEEPDFSSHLIQTDSGCYFDLTYDTTLSIAGGQLLNTIGQLYPNPAQNEIRLSYSLPTPAESHLVITDAFGRTIKTLHFRKGIRKVTIPLTGNAPGMYYLNFWTGKQHFLQKFVLTGK